MSGGMQTSAISNLYCKCGKKTSRIIREDEKEIAIHFGKKKIFWCIFEKNKITKTYKQPIEWD